MKITQEQIQYGQELLQELVAEAWKNPEFKAELISSPVSTISNLTGKGLTLPSNTKIIVEDQMDTSVIYINIPRKVEVDDIELTETQLAAVSGGLIDPISVGVTIGTAIVGLFMAGFQHGRADRAR